MGLFNDYRNTKRDGWSFTYTGGQLAEPARRKLAQCEKLETEARELSSVLVKDPTVSRKDERLVKASEDVDVYGDLNEKLRVWVHEFTRNPEREYSLSLGDVTFFELEKGNNSGVWNKK